MRSPLDFRSVDAARRRVAGTLTLAMMVIYFGFILLVAFARPLMAMKVGAGVTSLGIVLGLAVIVAAWLLIWIYVRWANTHYDRAIAGLRTRG